MSHIIYSKACCLKKKDKQEGKREREWDKKTTVGFDF